MKMQKVLGSLLMLVCIALVAFSPGSMASPIQTDTEEVTAMVDHSSAPVTIVVYVGLDAPTCLAVVPGTFPTYTEGKERTMPSLDLSFNDYASYTPQRHATNWRLWEYKFAISTEKTPLHKLFSGNSRRARDGVSC